MQINLSVTSPAAITGPHPVAVPVIDVFRDVFAALIHPVVGRVSAAADTPSPRLLPGGVTDQPCGIPVTLPKEVREDLPEDLSDEMSEDVPDAAVTAVAVPAPRVARWIGEGQDMPPVAAPDPVPDEVSDRVPNGAPDVVPDGEIVQPAAAPMASVALRRPSETVGGGPDRGLSGWSIPRADGCRWPPSDSPSPDIPASGRDVVAQTSMPTRHADGDGSGTGAIFPEVVTGSGDTVALVAGPFPDSPPQDRRRAGSALETTVGSSLRPRPQPSHARDVANLGPLLEVFAQVRPVSEPLAGLSQPSAPPGHLQPAWPPRSLGSGPVEQPPSHNPAAEAVPAVASALPRAPDAVFGAPPAPRAGGPAPVLRVTRSDEHTAAGASAPSADGRRQPTETGPRDAAGLPAPAPMPESGGGLAGNLPWPQRPPQEGSVYADVSAPLAQPRPSVPALPPVEGADTRPPDVAVSAVAVATQPLPEAPWSDTQGPDTPRPDMQWPDPAGMSPVLDRRVGDSVSPRQPGIHALPSPVGGLPSVTVAPAVRPWSGSMKPRAAAVTTYAQHGSLVTARPVIVSQRAAQPASLPVAPHLPAEGQVRVAARAAPDRGRLTPMPSPEVPPPQAAYGPPARHAVLPKKTGAPITVPQPAGTDAALPDSGEAAALPGPGRTISAPLPLAAPGAPAGAGQADVGPPLPMRPAPQVMAPRPADHRSTPVAAPDVPRSPRSGPPVTIPVTIPETIPVSPAPGVAALPAAAAIRPLFHPGTAGVASHATAAAPLSTVGGQGGSDQAAGLWPAANAVSDGPPPSVTGSAQMPLRDTAPASSPLPARENGQQGLPEDPAGSAQPVADRADLRDPGGVPPLPDERPGQQTGTPRHLSHAALDRVSDLSRQIALGMDRRAEPVTEIQLDPVELGRLCLTVQATEDTVTLFINAERGETTDLLRRHINELATTLRGLGYADVAIQLGNSGQMPQGRAGQGQPMPAHTAPPVTENVDTDMPRPSRAGLDLRL